VSGLNTLCVVSLLTARRLPAKRQRVADGVKILLDIAKESSDWFPPLKSALGGVGALIKHYEVWVEWVTIAHNLHERSQEFDDVREKLEGLKPQLDRLKQNITTTKIDKDPEETRRREELARCIYRPFAVFVLINNLCSALGEIEKESRDLLAKGTAARFVDKGADSGEVAKLVERLREAITHYQVSVNCFVTSDISHAGGQISQQQAIYDKITNLTVRIPLPVSFCCADERFFYQVIF
jgi:hypothetical protein